MSYEQWTGSSDTAPFTAVNKNMDALGQGFLFSERRLGHTGLTVGFNGGTFDVNTVADGTVAGLTDNTTNYLVVHRTTRAVTSSTATTNWNNTSTYGRMARAIFSSGVLTWHDERRSPGGIFDHSAIPGAVDAAAVTYTPATASDWSGDTDPGDVNEALDQIAVRLVVVEAAGASDEHYETDGTPSSDDTWAGRAITGVNAGATIAQWETVRMGSGGEWLLADATDATTSPCRGMAAEAGTDNNPMSVVTEGVIRNDAWNWSTLGAPIYLSITAGGLTQTAPSATGEIVQPVGFAITSDVMYLCIGAATYIEVS